MNEGLDRLYLDREDGRFSLRGGTLRRAGLEDRQASKRFGRRHLRELNRLDKQIGRLAATRKLLGVMFYPVKEEIDYEEFFRSGCTCAVSS